MYPRYTRDLHPELLEVSGASSPCLHRSWTRRVLVFLRTSYLDAWYTQHIQYPDLTITLTHMLQISSTWDFTNVVKGLY